MKPSVLPPELSKTVYFTPWAVFSGGFATVLQTKLDFPINLNLQKKFVLKHTVLYIHYVDLLMWSPTKLDFSFYDFSMIYYDFSKIHRK